MTTATARLVRRNNDRVDTIFVEASTADTVQQASDEIAEILRQRHRTQLGEDDFTVFS